MTPLLATPEPEAAASAAPTRVCLVVVFNHRFEANLDKLDALYGPRFPHILYLIPFYQGNRADVAPVYYSSHTFQGFVLEAWRQLRNKGFTHLVFIADDMLVNPRLEAGNICAELRVTDPPGSAFILFPRPITDVTCAWPYLMRVLTAMIGNQGVNWEPELPGYQEAVDLLRPQGFAPGRFGWRTVEKGMTVRSFFLLLYYVALFRQRRKKHPGLKLTDPPYPLVESNADFFVVPTGVMDRFCHLCGVFAAMGVFVEVGLTTALALSAPLVRRPGDRWRLRGEISRPETWEAFGQSCGFDLKQAAARMEEGELYLHPIKLSRWKF